MVRQEYRDRLCHRMDPGQLSHYEKVGCGAWPPEDTVTLVAARSSACVDGSLFTRVRGRYLTVISARCPETIFLYHLTYSS